MKHHNGSTPTRQEPVDSPGEIRDARTPGFYIVDNEVIEVHGAELGCYGIAVYSALCMYAGAGGTAFPSYATLAKQLGCSRRKVIDAMAQLRELGLVSVRHRQSADGDPDSNLYTVHAPAKLSKYCGNRASAGGGAQDALGVVHDVHQGGASGAPKQEPTNKNHSKQEPECVSSTSDQRSKPKQRNGKSPTHTKGSTKETKSKRRAVEPELQPFVDAVRKLCHLDRVTPTDQQWRNIDSAARELQRMDADPVFVSEREDLIRPAWMADPLMPHQVPEHVAKAQDAQTADPLQQAIDYVVMH